MQKKRILLLNPPWKKVYFRDLYCSASSKGSYLWHPIDLVVLSGILGEDFTVEFLDCIAQRIDAKSVLDHVKRNNFEGVVILTSSLTQNNDLELASQIKESSGTKVLINGGVALYEHDRIMRENIFLDGILFDFTTTDAADFFKGNLSDIKNMVFRDSEGGIISRFQRDKSGVYSHRMPLHRLFLSNRYFVPGGTSRQYASVLTSYGCMFNCSFCTYTNRALGFKFRRSDEVIEELKLLISLSVNEVHFRDACFPCSNPEYLQLYKKMVAQDLKLKWLCNSRVDLVDEEVLRMMKDAGCHTIFFGVESGDDEVLKSQSKRITTAQIRKAFALCSKLGIRTGAFFIFGFPQDTAVSMKKTISLAKELDCYIASFNLAMPLEGTQLREQIGLENDPSRSKEGFDISSGERIITNNNCSSRTIAAYKRKAVWEFYARPGFLFKYALKIRSLRELQGMCANAISLFGSLMSKG